MKDILDKNNKIIGRIHEDGTITEGTGNCIAGRIHEDGTITEGTSNNLAGRITIEGRNDGDVGFAVGIIFVFIAIGLLIFSIFCFLRLWGK